MLWRKQSFSMASLSAVFVLTHSELRCFMPRSSVSSMMIDWFTLDTY